MNASGSIFPFRSVLIVITMIMRGLIEHGLHCCNPFCSAVKKWTEQRQMSWRIIPWYHRIGRQLLKHMLLLYDGNEGEHYLVDSNGTVAIKFVRTVDIVIVIDRCFSFALRQLIVMILSCFSSSTYRIWRFVCYLWWLLQPRTWSLCSLSDLAGRRKVEPWLGLVRLIS